MMISSKKLVRMSGTKNFVRYRPEITVMFVKIAKYCYK